MATRTPRLATRMIAIGIAMDHGCFIAGWKLTPAIPGKHGMPTRWTALCIAPSGKVCGFVHASLGPMPVHEWHDAT